MKKYIWIAVLCFVCLGALIAPSDFRKNHDTFDAERWRNSDPRTRGQMVLNLLDRENELLGKTKTEIVEIFGEPDVRGASSISYHFKQGLLMEEIIPSKMYVIIEFNVGTGLCSKLLTADA